MELGIIGLGSIGGGLAKQAVEKGISVTGVDTEERPELTDKGVTVLDAGEYETLAEELDQPRAIYLSLPAGPLVDDELDALVPHLDEGDVVMDGGNSFWRDSMERADRLADDGVHYLDTGTSGGPPGARSGACFMVGGPEDGFETVEPILDELSVEGGLIHAGPSGSGHFVKLVHNGVEFGMLQAIGEGVELLKDSEFDLDLTDVFHNWSNGSVIRSWLVELMEQQLREENIEEIPNYVEDTGEVNWLVEEAIKSETPAPVITQSVIELFKSRGEQRYTYPAISMMRHGFGTHPFGESESIENERVSGRVSGESRYELSQKGIDPDEM